jgi:hypothetical protein
MPSGRPTVTGNRFGPLSAKSWNRQADDGFTSGEPPWISQNAKSDDFANPGIRGKLVGQKAPLRLNASLPYQP